MWSSLEEETVEHPSLSEVPVPVFHLSHLGPEQSIWTVVTWTTVVVPHFPPPSSFFPPPPPTSGSISISIGYLQPGPTIHMQIFSPVKAGLRHHLRENWLCGSFSERRR